MAILTHDDFMNRVKSIIGEDTSDESISLLEDFTDTIKDLETKASANGGSVAEYEQKLKDLDKSWRDKYTARFFDGGSSDEHALLEHNDEGGAEDTPQKFDDLFTESEV